MLNFKKVLLKAQSCSKIFEAETYGKEGKEIYDKFQNIIEKNIGF